MVQLLKEEWNEVILFYERLEADCAHQYGSCPSFFVGYNARQLTPSTNGPRLGF